MANGKLAIAGAVQLYGDNCNITDCTFKSNHADLYAGAILLNSSGSIIKNSLFENNNAHGINESFGGAILVRGDNNYILDCNFTSNVCSHYGGAVTVVGSNNVISKSLFKRNNVTFNGVFNFTSPEGGGAIYSICNNLTIDNCSFIENVAGKGWGGAVSLSENDTLENSFFNANSADVGNDVAFGMNIKFNYFILDYMESVKRAVAVNMNENDLINLNNTFNRTKINSTVIFNPVSQGMGFTYGGYDSIVVIVEGGKINLENITVLNHKEAKITFNQNLLTVSNLPVGKYVLRVTTTPDENHTSVSSELTVTVTKAIASISASKATVALKKSTLWTMKFTDSKGKPISGMKVSLKVYTGKKYKTITVYTNSKGVASYQTKKLAKGSHKIVVSATHKNYNFKTFKSSIKVVKQKALKFKVKKKTKKGVSVLSIYVFNKKTKKAMNGVKIKLLIYTGKQYRTITLKSMKKGKKKGVCGFASNRFSVGKHKVKILPFSIKYSGSKSTTMKISKKAKSYPSWEAKDTAK